MVRVQDSLRAPLGPDQKLHIANRRVAIERYGDIEMQYVSERGAGVRQTQTEPDVAQQPSRTLCERGVSEWSGPPHLTDIGEHRRTDTE
jgi:hypothetical protein